MEWHYVQNGKQAGPVSDAQFADLIRAGTIRPDTLVWHQGMSQWQPCQAVQPAAAGASTPAPGDVACAECGRTLPRTEMISYANFWVCAACKPVFFQRLKEGVQPARALIWRSGNLLVVSRDAALPDRCVKCNAPAHGRRLKRKLYWHHPAIYLLVLCSLLIYIIVALIVRKRADLEIGLCERHLAKRKSNVWLSWILALLGIGLIIGAISIESGWAGLAGAVVLVGSLVYAAVTTPMVAAKRIETDHAWVRGVCREYLDSLPEWTGP